MQALRNNKFVQLVIAVSFSALAVGCAAESTGEFRSAITGDACLPDDTYVARDISNGNGNTSPTGIPGDNLDDLRSGQIDCLGDGDSGQGNDDRKCVFPPGCDSQGCCDGDMFPEEPEAPEAEEPEAEAPEAEEPAPSPDPVVL